MSLNCRKVKAHEHATRRQSRGCKDAFGRDSTTYGVFSRDRFIDHAGDETAALKEKIEALEVELEKLKNINEFNDDILQHKEADIEELAQKCEGLTQLNSQLMTRLEIMNREMNELKITSEEFDIKSEAGSASTVSGDRDGFTSVPGSESVALGINSQTSLLTSSLSLGVPVPRTTQSV